MNKSLNVLVTQKAGSDIAQIIDYVAKDNPKAARDILTVLNKTLKMLAEYPTTGTVKYGIKQENIRVYTIKKKFSIAYRLEDNQLKILRILTRYQDILTIL